MSKLQNAIVGGVRTALGFVPSSWLPGATPDPLTDRRVTLGTQQSRVDGPENCLLIQLTKFFEKS